MPKWSEVPLGDVLILQRGFDITKKELREGLVPVVSSSGVSYFHDEAKVLAPGVVIGRKGSLGKTHLLTVPFWPHDTTLWVKNFKSNDPYFCYFLLKFLKLENLDVGASNPTLNRNHVHQVLVSIPDLSTQRRIASFLLAFQEVIKINERRIELVEQTIRALYRNWFERLRFPGLDGSKFKDSSLGQIPEDWQELTLSEVAKITMGQSPKSEFISETADGPPFHQGVGSFGPQIPVTARYCTSAARFAEPLDILCSVRAPVGRLNVADQHLGIGRGLSAVRRFDDAQAFLRFQLRQALGEEDSLGSGTIYKAIGRDQLKGLSVLEPNQTAVEKFESRARPALDWVMKLVPQNRLLSDLHDLLLPRLITGQLDISDIDLGVLTPTED